MHIDQPVLQTLHLSRQFIEATREIQHVRVQLPDLVVGEADGLFHALNTIFKSRKAIGSIARVVRITPGMFRIRGRHDTHERIR